MKLISLGSSSDGNCHILYTNGVGIMLDCGANVKNINAVIKDYNIKHILLTHKHQDHILSILENKIADKGTMYKGMKPEEQYSLEELGLFRGDDEWWF